MNSYLKLYLIICALVLTCCKSSLTNNTNITVTKAFRIVEHNKDLDEILALRYQNEMLVTISLNNSKIIKKGSLFGYGVLESAMMAKFPRLVKQHNGTNVSELKKIDINGNVYLYQSFDFGPSDRAGYYEYGGLYTEQPEEYYEFFISGDKTKQVNHREIIMDLLKGV